MGGGAAEAASPSAAVVRREYLRCVRKVHPDKLVHRAKGRAAAAAAAAAVGSFSNSGSSSSMSSSSTTAMEVDDPLPAALARKLFAALTDAYRFWMDTH
jgi:hypothetical protein